jgi:cytochrome P450
MDVCGSQVVTGHARVRGVLGDPGYTVPDPGSGAPPGTMIWLRQNVARFSEGADHARRRSLAVDLLRPVDPGRLRAAARDQANAVIDAANGRPFDVMARAARRVPGRVLAAALGAADPAQVAGLLAPVAAVYQPGPADPASAGASVARLAALLGRPGEAGEGGAPDERVAARIGLLIQAYDATAGLIGNGVAAALRAPGRPAPARGPAGTQAEVLVERTLRADPPVLVTRRVAPDGTTATLDLTCAGQGSAANDGAADDTAADDTAAGLGAGHLEFGWGPHACPGADHARALAEGIIGPLVARCRWTGAQIRYPPPPALRVPERLEVTPVR